MRENNERNSRKRLNALILLVAFTAVLLIVSTYAWFSTQKNVTLSNLDGKVNVAEGLQISLDAEHWSNSIDFSQYKNDQSPLKKQYGENTHNLIPTEMLPVSTTATEQLDSTGSGTGIKELSFYRGTNSDSIKLYDVKAVSNDLTKVDATGESLEEGNTTITAKSADVYPGYYAIDFFLQNSSAETTGTDVLQLNTGSLVTVKADGNNSVGLQNTPRVALALYNSDKTAGKVGVSDTAADILAATTGAKSTIKDVAIWEPNANAHVDYIVENNNYKETGAYSASAPATKGFKLSATDYTAYKFPTETTAEDLNKPYKFTATQLIPTYALNSTSVSQEGKDTITLSDQTTKKGYNNLYDWTGTYSTKGMAKQISLQTASGNGTAAVNNLISVTSTDASVTPNATGKEGIVNFEIPKGEVCRIRMYIWLEGQDVDCINYASHGGGIDVTLGLIKGVKLDK